MRMNYSPKVVSFRDTVTVINPGDIPLESTRVQTSPTSIESTPVSTQENDTSHGDKLSMGTPIKFDISSFDMTNDSTLFDASNNSTVFDMSQNSTLYDMSNNPTVVECTPDVNKAEPTSKLDSKEELEWAESPAKGGTGHPSPWSISTEDTAEYYDAHNMPSEASREPGPEMEHAHVGRRLFMGVEPRRSSPIQDVAPSPNLQDESSIYGTDLSQTIREIPESHDTSSESSPLNRTVISTTPRIRRFCQTNRGAMDEIHPVMVQPRADSPTLIAERQRPREPNRDQTRTNLISTLLILTSFSIQSSTANFNFVNPVVWRPSDRDVVSAEGEIVARLYLNNTCEIYANKLNLTHDLNKSFMTWCSQEFEQSVLKPIKANSEGNGVFRSRVKRELFIILSITAALLAGLGAIGVGIYDTVNLKTVTDINNQLRANQEIAQEAIKRIEQHINVLVEKTNDHSKWRTEFERSSFLTTMVTAGLSSKFHATHVQLIDFFENWKDRKLSTHLFSIFNITQKDIHLYPRRLMTPISCQLNPYENYIDLMIHGYKLNPNFTVMNADPFYLTGTYGECLFYDGPNSVLYDLTSKQVCDSYECAYVGPLQLGEDFQCHPKQFNGDKFWKRKKCPDIRSHQSYLQVKSYDKFRYIYCSGHKIFMANKSHDCPPWVFTYPTSLPLQIDNYSFPFFSIRSESQLIDPKHFDFVENNVFAGMQHPELIPKLEITKFQSHDSTYINLWFYLFLAVLLILIFGLSSRCSKSLGRYLNLQRATRIFAPVYHEVLTNPPNEPSATPNSLPLTNLSSSSSHTNQNQINPVKGTMIVIPTN